MLKHNDNLNDLFEALASAIELFEMVLDNNPSAETIKHRYDDCKRLQETVNKDFTEYIDFLKDCN